MFPQFEISIGSFSHVFHTQNVLAVIVLLIWVWALLGWAAHRAPLWKSFLLVTLTCFFSLLGGRLFHVLIERRQYFLENPAQIFTRLDGLTFYGEFLLGVPVYFGLAVLLFKERAVRSRLSDLAGMGIAFAYGVLKLGCLANGCCWGRLCRYPWAVTYSNENSFMPYLGIPVHPVQIYESLGSFAIGMGLVLLYRRRSVWHGKLFFLFCVAYALMRFTTEFFRGDAIRGTDALLGLSTSQVISIPVLLLGMGGLIWTKIPQPRRRRSHA